MITSFTISWSKKKKQKTARPHRFRASSSSLPRPHSLTLPNQKEVDTPHHIAAEFSSASLKTQGMGARIGWTGYPNAPAAIFSQPTDKSGTQRHLSHTFRDFTALYSGLSLILFDTRLRMRLSPFMCTDCI